MEKEVMSKSALARSLGVSRSALYYVPRKEKKNWALKGRIEAVLREYPAYGSRRIAQALRLNRKGVRRVMRIFGIRPYRRRGRKWRKKRAITTCYKNLLSLTIPAYPQHVWAADFTELGYGGKWVYVAKDPIL
jgi:putative transposase